MKKYIDSYFFDEERTAITFIFFSIAGSFLFIIVPIIFSFSLSFMSWDLLSIPNFVGFKNYIYLFNSKQFWQIMINTFFYAIVVTLIGTLLPLILAYLLTLKIKASELFKTAYFLPFVTPMLVVAAVWEWMFNPASGVINFVLKSNINWLYDTHFAMFAIIIVSVWKLVGYNMIIFLSGFSNINNQLIEAAKIDGASQTSIFARIILPLLSPTIFFVVLITTISSFQVFDLIYLMTQGGPENSTNILVYWLYKNAFEFFRIGEASAIAYILFLIIFILAIIQWNVRKSWVYNE